jgi:putative DNA-invertase from lambdoid prophage Rac
VKAAIYLRVSTDRQDQSNQEPACRQLCEARGWLDPLVVSEVGSGASSRRHQRPLWLDLLERARRGEVRALVIWAIDRMGRDMFDVLADVNGLRRSGCAVVSVNEWWLDSDRPEGDLLLAQAAWFAKRERDRWVERIKAGQARSRGQGIHMGRPAFPVASSAADRVRELRLAGLSWPAIRDQLAAEHWAVPSAKTLARVAYGTKAPIGPRPIRPPIRAALGPLPDTGQK